MRNIFVIVGTHEQQFNRLVKVCDDLKGYNVFIQTGFSDYLPKNASFLPFLSFQQMQEKLAWSDIIITHGGPGSILDALRFNKVPIVVPREKRYGEHVNDHQVEFCEYFSSEGAITCLRDVSKLESLLCQQNPSSYSPQQKTSEFVANFENIIKLLFSDTKRKDLVYKCKRK